MKHIVFLLITGFLAFNNCSGQDKKVKDNQDNKIIEKGRSNSPQINSKVKKEYDENGNLKSFDSTYTYVYNSLNGNLPDSLSGMFSKHFNHRFFSGDSTLFGDFFRDDHFPKDLFENDRFFKNPFQDNFAGNDSTERHLPRIAGPDEQIFNSDRFRQMFRDLDSLNKKFMKHNFDPEKFFREESGKLKKENSPVL